jgi:gas vesicle protein
MRFLFGLLIGFAVGFAGALLFAPKASPLRQERADDDPARKAVDEFGGSNHHDSSGVQGVIQGLQKQVSEAIKEAKKAAEDAEKEVHRRFEEMVEQQPIDE